MWVERETPEIMIVVEHEDHWRLGRLSMKKVLGFRRGWSRHCGVPMLVLLEVSKLRGNGISTYFVTQVSGNFHSNVVYFVLKNIAVSFCTIFIILD
jgi:hypothetical protein